MPAAKQVAFGKRGASPAAPAPVSARGTAFPVVAVLVAGFAIALIGGALILTRSPGVPPVSTTADAVSSGGYLLTGIWAANGQSCDAAKMKIQFDGSNISSVSILGTLPIGPYTVSGSNPVTLTFSNGDHIVWDASNEGRLVPISIVPKQEKDNFEMMHLTRC
ncbi:hypothetical protein [Devosia sp. SL43]|uniref:hypothetical protein n=1 Tax=Devosia sp. SL43 TaxID=2806348 RepID=UPI001F276725|nr:hypothetical protein [Devosia sp. SL43]UJW84020.1 hypothetical protein IM737_11170 [Devosia sp. SL43]